MIIALVFGLWQIAEHHALPLAPSGSTALCLKSTKPNKDASKSANKLLFIHSEPIINYWHHEIQVL